MSIPVLLFLLFFFLFSTFPSTVSSFDQPFTCNCGCCSNPIPGSFGLCLGPVGFVGYSEQNTAKCTGDRHGDRDYCTTSCQEMYGVSCHGQLLANCIKSQQLPATRQAAAEAPASQSLAVSTSVIGNLLRLIESSSPERALASYTGPASTSALGSFTCGCYCFDSNRPKYYSWIAFEQPTSTTNCDQACTSDIAEICTPAHLSGYSFPQLQVGGNITSACFQPPVFPTVITRSSGKPVSFDCIDGTLTVNDTDIRIGETVKIHIAIDPSVIPDNTILYIETLYSGTFQTLNTVTRHHQADVTFSFVAAGPVQVTCSNCHTNYVWLYFPYVS